MFVFITHDPRVLLPPLVSRLTKLHFSRLSTNALVSALTEHFKAAPSEAARLAARSFGRIGRALELRDGTEDDSITVNLSKKITTLYLKDKVTNAAAIGALLDRETKLKRFRLNPKLQQKAIDAVTT